MSSYWVRLTPSVLVMSVYCVSSEGFPATPVTSACSPVTSRSPVTSVY